MKNNAKKKTYMQIALALSVFLLIIWAILGTGASLAWFSDTSPEIDNIFHFAEFDVAVSHQLTDGSWEEIDAKTKIFDEEALYEPGYVQVVYLKVENKGTVPFDFYTAVNVNGCIEATNVFGHSFMLQEYLKFGITQADSLQALKETLPDRETAAELSNMPLHNYSDQKATLPAGGVKYIAVVVRMPEEVGNIANYRGERVPKVELGLTVKADQIRK